ncbi:transporter substrate-binding domain-containing protein [Streptomyces sp. NBC_00151]|uniref:transporter substrate-binding domain-containing protein n=2 Tax=unclassified Streptomyces TaxID=2593676 RepID=UPI002DDC3151|nr:transporter substrate-binding domain-containing protein [Streptomyces sp. NBC_00151]WRZ44090.1 transporter substrate-binding domain-containing protein [Streptomyces sp. NBC_00151]
MTAPAVRGFTVMKHLTALGAITGAAALALTGCGDQTPKKVTPSVSGTVKAPLYDELPASVRQAGVVKVGSDMLYPPMEFVRNGKPVGVDPDLADVMGRELGVRFEFANSAFDTLLTGLRAKHYDAVMSAMSDTKDRQEGLDPSTGEKIGEDIDFVDYFTSGSSIMVKKGNPEGVNSPADLCGKKAAVQSGSTAYDLLQSQKCDEPIDIEAYDTHDEAQARLKAGGVVADVADYPVVAYAAKTAGDGKDFEVVGEQIDAGPYGIGVLSSNTRLRDALRAALDAAVRDGSYGKVLSKWNVGEGAVTDATINSGT